MGKWDWISRHDRIVGAKVVRPGVVFHNTASDANVKSGAAIATAAGNAPALEFQHSAPA